MVHHEPWGTRRFICSLPAVYRSCAFHIGPRYPAHKCLMPMASLLILLSGSVSHCVPLCRVLAATIGLFAPPVGSETKFDGFVRDILHPKAQTLNMALFPQ
jgi:hypothetical protein